MATSVSLEQLRSLVYGACFLASGGGGPISMALQFLERMKGPVPMVALHELSSFASDTDQVLILADMGSPDKAAEGFGYTAPINVFHTMKDYLAQTGSGNVSYLLPIELGAVNSLIPFFIASQLPTALPVVDADPSGRSVPQLNETLLDASGQAICPAAVASDTAADGSVVSQIFLGMDATTLEDQSRVAVSGEIYHEVAGLACYPMSAAWLGSSAGSQALVPGSLSAAMLVGDLMQTTQSVAALQGLLDVLKVSNYVLFEGVLSDMKNSTEGGFDIGKMIFTDTAGEEFWVYYKNESLLAWDPLNKVAKVIAPDCINLVLTADFTDPATGKSVAAGSPLSTADVVKGMSCRVWGTSCSEKMRTTRMENLFMANIQQIEQAYPDDGLQVQAYVPIEKLNG